MINKYYPPHLGGIEYHLRDLADGARRARPLRSARSSRTRAATRVTRRSDGVEVTRLPRQFAYLLGAGGARDAARDPSGSPPTTDVLHLHFPYPWGELGVAASPRTGAARPSSPTTATSCARSAGLAALPAVPRARRSTAWTSIIASSPNMVEHSEFLQPRAEKCRVVPFGIHVERYAATPEVDARARRAARASTRGRDRAVRRPAHLLQGRRRARAGDGGRRRRPRDHRPRAARARAARDRRRQRASPTAITLLPPVADDELVAWYHAADVFCLPSVARSEAFGLVQLEAHASGTPVVSTTLTTGVPFVNQDGVTGLTVPPGDVAALAAALQPARRRRRAARAPRRAGARARACATSPSSAWSTTRVALYASCVGLH